MIQDQDERSDPEVEWLERKIVLSQYEIPDSLAHMLSSNSNDDIRYAIALIEADNHTSKEVVFIINRFYLRSGLRTRVIRDREGHYIIRRLKAIRPPG